MGRFTKKNKVHYRGIECRSKRIEVTDIKSKVTCEHCKIMMKKELGNVKVLTKEQVDDVCEMHIKGEALKVIAYKYRVTSTTIIRYLKERECYTNRRRVITDKDIEVAMKNINNGMSYRKASLLLGFGESSLYFALKRKGLLKNAKS